MLYLMILRFCGQFLLAKLINFIFAYIVIYLYHYSPPISTASPMLFVRARLPYLSLTCRHLPQKRCLKESDPGHAKNSGSGLIHLFIWSIIWFLFHLFQ